MSRCITSRRPEWFGLRATAYPSRRPFFTSGSCNRTKSGRDGENGSGHSSGGQQTHESPWPKVEWTWIPASLGFACISILALRRSLDRHERNRARAERTATIYNGIEIDSWKTRLAMVYPYRTMSRVWGWLTALYLPVWMRRPVLGVYTRLYECNLEEAERGSDLTQYHSLLEFFSRHIKPELRPISDDYPIVSPCDGTVAHVAKVDRHGNVEQVKGISYPVHALFGPGIAPVTDGTAKDTAVGKATANGACCAGERHLYQFIVYLSPGDYHHFHSPAVWSVQHRRHFSGELLPVAPLFFNRVAGLMALNERVVLTGKWHHGFFSMVAVGAYNVGSMKVIFDKKLSTNSSSDNYIPGFYRDNSLSDINLRPGSYVGKFLLGSTVALVFEAPAGFEFSVKAGDKIRVGEPVGTWK